jgi:PKD repeat protein
MRYLLLSCCFVLLLISNIQAQNCHAAFAFSVSQNKATFYNNSLSGFKSLWNFGDGTTDTLFATTPHFYTAAGDYLVCYTNYNGTCTDTYCDTISIKHVPCDANFGTTLSGNNLHLVNQAIGSAINYTWDYGDGTQSNLYNAPAHIYAVADTYTVCLTVTDSFCNSTICDTIYVVNGPCNSNFAHFQTDNAVTFVNQATPSTFYYWTFGDNGSSSSKSDSLKHTYLAVGKYEVCLTVYDTACSHTFCDSVTVSVVNGFDQQLANATKIGIYPNPANDVLTITCSSNLDLNSGFQVRNSMGQLVSVGPFIVKNKIAIDQLNDGIYLLQVTDHYGQPHQAHFVKVSTK